MQLPMDTECSCLWPTACSCLWPTACSCLWPTTCSCLWPTSCSCLWPTACSCLWPTACSCLWPTACSCLWPTACSCSPAKMVLMSWLNIEIRLTPRKDLWDSCQRGFHLGILQISSQLVIHSEREQGNVKIPLLIHKGNNGTWKI